MIFSKKPKKQTPPKCTFNKGQYVDNKEQANDNLKVI